jgi:hypothetical protein
METGAETLWGEDRIAKAHRSKDTEGVLSDVSVPFARVSADEGGQSTPTTCTTCADAAEAHRSES